MIPEAPHPHGGFGSNAGEFRVAQHQDSAGPIEAPDNRAGGWKSPRKSY